MASLRPSFLSQRAPCSRPFLQLERQFALLRVGPAQAYTPSAAARTSRILARASHSASNDRHKDDPAGLETSIPDSIAENTAAMDEIIESLSTGNVGGDSAIQDALASRSQFRSSSNSDSGKGLDLPVIHARALPVSPSYFTRQPYFIDRYLRLQELFRRYGNLPLLPTDKVERVAWKTIDDYRRHTGEFIKAPQYNKCMAILKHLHKIHPSLKPPGVTEVVGEFLRDVNPFHNVPRQLTIDRFGRAIGVGRRKTSVARAWVVEGTGEVIVNGKSLSDAFGRVHDRESATWALRATDRTDKYNVWALVDGGGTTGQAEALTLAVAKAMVAHEPALKTALRKAGCISRDPRMVERKKTGHVKARKMPAWVKR